MKKWILIVFIIGIVFFVTWNNKNTWFGIYEKSNSSDYWIIYVNKEQIELNKENPVVQTELKKRNGGTGEILLVLPYDNEMLDHWWVEDRGEGMAHVLESKMMSTGKWFLKEKAGSSDQMQFLRVRLTDLDYQGKGSFTIQVPVSELNGGQYMITVNYE